MKPDGTKSILGLSKNIDETLAVCSSSREKIRILSKFGLPYLRKQ